MIGEPQLPSGQGQLILGIDPGLNITGYGLIIAHAGRIDLIEAGVVRGGGHGPLEKRVSKIFAGIEEVIEQHQPAAVAIEELYSHYQTPRTAILMGHARGVICLAAGRQEIPLFHYASTQVKKVLTGNGHAPKKQVQLAICREFGLSEAPEPNDVADALAIALCHHFLSRNAIAS